MIYALTKRAINSSMLPADAGCIVDNVETLIGIHNAVINGRPLTERIVTVSGDDVQKPGNFKVLLGTNHRELIEAAGGFLQEPEKLISGGPMMGFAMITLDAPVTKTSSAILAFKEDIVAKSLETACINCGRCVEVVRAGSFRPDWQTLQSVLTRKPLLRRMDWNVWNAVPAAMSVRQNVP